MRIRHDLRESKAGIVEADIESVHEDENVTIRTDPTGNMGGYFIAKADIVQRSASDQNKMTVAIFRAPAWSFDVSGPMNRRNRNRRKGETRLGVITSDSAGIGPRRGDNSGTSRCACCADEPAPTIAAVDAVKSFMPVAMQPPSARHSTAPRAPLNDARRRDGRSNPKAIKSPSVERGLTQLRPIH